MTVGRRAQQQIRNRERILAAAREEFAQVGYREAKINSIATRAELTRGAIYSNFPSKRALGLTVAADPRTAKSPTTQPSASRNEVAVSLAQAWLSRLPIGSHSDQADHLTSDLYAEIRQDRDQRDACAALMQLAAIILAHALERIDLDGSGERAVRAATALLTILHSTSSLSALATGFVDPFTIVATCEAVATTDFDDRWTPPHESIVPATRTINHAWEPPTGPTDLITNTPVDWRSDGIVAVLGLRQAAGIEQALRAAPHGHSLTLVLVTDDPAERIPLARFVLSELVEALRPSVPGETLTGLSVVLDYDGTIARAAGLRAATDDTHVALRIHDHRIIEQAEGPAACHAVAMRLGQPTSR